MVYTHFYANYSDSMTADVFSVIWPLQFNVPTATNWFLEEKNEERFEPKLKKKCFIKNKNVLLIIALKDNDYVSALLGLKPILDKRVHGNCDNF